MGRRTPIGAFVHSSWINMNIRAGKYKHLQTSKKCSSYETVKVDITREEYKQLCIDNQHLILNLQRPSVDRIDKNRDYTRSNIQFVELSENIRKDKTVFKDGFGTCSICKEHKPEDQFAKDSRRSNGRSSICKICDNKR